MSYDNEAKGYIGTIILVIILNLFAFVKREIVPEGFEPPETDFANQRPIQARQRDLSASN